MITMIIVSVISVLVVMGVTTTYYVQNRNREKLYDKKMQEYATKINSAHQYEYETNQDQELSIDKVRNDVLKYNDQIVKISKDFDYIKNQQVEQINNLNTNYDSLKSLQSSDINKVTSVNNEQDNKINTITTDVSGLKTDIKTANDKITVINGQIVNIGEKQQTAINSLIADNTKIKTEQGSLRDTVYSVQNDYTGKIKTVLDTTASVKTNVDTLNNSFNNLNNSLNKYALTADADKKYASTSALNNYALTADADKKYALTSALNNYVTASDYNAFKATIPDVPTKSQLNTLIGKYVVQDNLTPINNSISENQKALSNINLLLDTIRITYATKSDLAVLNTTSQGTTVNIAGLNATLQAYNSNLIKMDNAIAGLSSNMIDYKTTVENTYALKTTLDTINTNLQGQINVLKTQANITADNITANKSLYVGANGNFSIDGATMYNKGRQHIHGEELLYLLNKSGVVIGKELGGNGNLSVQGDASVNGGVTGSRLATHDKFNIQTAGGNGWWNGITKAGDKVLTNWTEDVKGGKVDKNGITLAPWNAAGGMRVHGAGADLNGDLQMQNNGSGITWGNNYSKIYDDGYLHITTDDVMNMKAPVYLNVDTPRTGIKGGLAVGSDMPDGWRGANVLRKDGRWSHLDWKDNGQNYLRGYTNVDDGLGVSGDVNVSGSVNINGSVSGRNLSTNDKFNIQTAGENGWWNGITKAGDKVLTNWTEDVKGEKVDKNGITIAPWNAAGGMRVHGAGADINGDLQMQNNGSGITWGNNYSKIYDDGNLHITTDDVMNMKAPVYLNVDTPRTGIKGGLAVGSDMPDGWRGANVLRKDGRWSHLDWTSNGQNYLRGYTNIDDGLGVNGDLNVSGSVNITGSRLATHDKFNIQTAGENGWWNGITKAGDKVLTNWTEDVKGEKVDKNGITIAPWNAAGGMRVHGAGADINGDLNVQGLTTISRGNGDWNWLRVAGNYQDNILLGSDNDNRGIWANGPRDFSIFNQGKKGLTVTQGGEVNINGPLNVDTKGGQMCIQYGPANQYKFCFQNDGHVVQYKNDKAVWSTGQYDELL